MRGSLLTATAWIMLGALAAPAQAQTALATLQAEVKADYDARLKDLFVHFHRNPELSYLETATAKRLAAELRALGVEVTEGVGGTGIVGVIKNGAGPTVLVRADMDGLPVEERSGLAYASTARQKDTAGVEQPVMHACGHDTHITALVGTARAMMARKNEWRGTLVLIGQPAEERIGGAKKMLDDGLYTRFPKPSVALAFHVNSLMPAGQLRVDEGIAFSSSDSVDILVRGVGAHGASPHKGVDPVLVASQIVVSLQSVVSRSINPLQPGVITVGSIHGGTKHNIIPEEVRLQLTVRSDDRAVRQQLLDGIARVAKGVAESLGVPADKLPLVQASGESTPPTVNDPGAARQVLALFERNFGPERIYREERQGMGAEDFAYFVAPEHGVKGVYFNVGGTPPEDLPSAASHHSPLFKIAPEPTIRTGIEAMTIAAIDFLGKP